MPKRERERPILGELESNARERSAWLRLLTAGRLNLSPVRAGLVRDLLFKVQSLARANGAEWTGTRQTLGRFLGRSPATVKRAIADAEAAGVLLVARRRGGPSSYLIDWRGVDAVATRPEPRGGVDWQTIRAERDARVGSKSGQSRVKVGSKSGQNDPGVGSQRPGGRVTTTRGSGQNDPTRTVENQIPTATNWREAEAALAAVGVGSTKPAIDAARESFADPADVVALVELWKRRRGRNTLGHLRARVAALLPDDDLERRWIHPLAPIPRATATAPTQETSPAVAAPVIDDPEFSRIVAERGSWAAALYLQRKRETANQPEDPNHDDDDTQGDTPPPLGDGDAEHDRGRTLAGRQTARAPGEPGPTSDHAGEPREVESLARA